MFALGAQCNQNPPANKRSRGAEGSTVLEENGTQERGRGGTALWVKVRVRKPLAEDSCGLKILQRQSKTSTTNTELGQA